MSYNILDFGAKGDGVTNDAKAIQSAIDSCYNNGGGTVFVPGGHTYMIGSIVLKSYVELHLENGATLKASTDMKDYATFESQRSLDTTLKVPSFENCEYAGKPVNYFIYAKDAEYVSITGYGKIDGSEEIYYGEDMGDYIDGAFYPRIPLIYMENVKQLTLKEVTLTKSGFWTTHLIGCEDVLIDGIRILNSLLLANCDGIDPDHCKSVRIANCYISCADDCIVFKNTGAYKEYGNCENITVTNCNLVSSSSAIKFGTESENDFKNIVVSNCNITNTNRGISIQLRDNGNIENVLFSNINIETRRSSKGWWGEAEAIAITAVDRKEGMDAGQVKNIVFENINCKGENGIFIYGELEKNIQNISFRNISVELESTTDWPKINHDIRPCKYDGIIEGKLNPVYVRNAKDISFENVRISVNDNVREYLGKEWDIDNSDNVNIV